MSLVTVVLEKRENEKAVDVSGHGGIRERSKEAVYC